MYVALPVDLKGLVADNQVNQRPGKDGGPAWTSVKLQLIPNAKKKVIDDAQFKPKLVEFEFGSNFQESAFAGANDVRNLVRGDLVVVRNAMVMFYPLRNEIHVKAGSLGEPVQVLKITEDDAEQAILNRLIPLLKQLPVGAKPVNDVWQSESITERANQSMSLSALKQLTNNPPRTADEKGVLLCAVRSPESVHAC